MNAVDNKKKVNKISKPQINFASYPSCKLNSPIKKYLPYYLSLNTKSNYKLFENLLLAGLLSVSFNTHSEASSQKATAVSSGVSENAKIASLRTIEAGIGLCEGDCPPPQRKVQSALSEYLCNLPAVQRGDFKCEDAAYTDDGNDRNSITLLREKKLNGEILTVEENAALVGANKVGWVRFPDCFQINEKGKKIYLSSNAFLSRDKNGNDIILTSAHLVTDTKNGEFLNGCALDQLSNAVYSYNISYADFSKTVPPSDSPIYTTVKAKPILNLGGFNSKKKIPTSDDFMVLQLETQISDKKALDGTVRGYFEFATPTVGRQTAATIGFDPRFDKNYGGRVLSYQKCIIVEDESTLTGEIGHLCDTIPGSSSSFIGVIQENVLKIRAMHSRSSPTLNEEGTNAVPESILEWNKAVPSQYIQRQLQIPES